MSFRIFAISVVALLSSNIIEYQDKRQNAERYVRTFIEEASKRNIHIDASSINISFVNTITSSPIWAGVCYTDTHRINIATSYWSGYKDSEREELVFHELGHCLLNRLHDSTMSIKGNPPQLLPNSIMYPIIMKEEQYLPNRTKYLDELFTKYVEISI